MISILVCVVSHDGRVFFITCVYFTFLDLECVEGTGVFCLSCYVGDCVCVCVCVCVRDCDWRGGERRGGEGRGREGEGEREGG